MKYIKFLLTSLTLFTYQLHAAQNLIVNIPGDSASSAAGTFTFGSPTSSSGDLRGCLHYINTTTISATDTFTITFNIPSGSETISLGQMLPIVNLANTNTVTIDGTNGGDQIIIDGGGAFRSFFIRQGTVTVENITLSNTGVARDASGFTSGGGGMGAGAGIFNDEAALTVDNVTFQSCIATGGISRVGGIGCAGGGGLGGNGGTRGTANGLSGGGGGGGIGGNGGNGATADATSGGVNGGCGGGGGSLGAGGNGGIANSITGSGTGGGGGGGGVGANSTGGAGGTEDSGGTGVGGAGGSGGTINGLQIGGGGGGGATSSGATGGNGGGIGCAGTAATSGGGGGGAGTGSPACSNAAGSTGGVGGVFGGGGGAGNSGTSGPGNAGGAGGLIGGGGGGGTISAGSTATGGAGGYGGGGGSPGGAGGFGAGGGGSGRLSAVPGGPGGFGGGGGSGSSTGTAGGNGGFGAGGGGGVGTAGTGGIGGGNGTVAPFAGGGGAGFGGAIFSRAGSVLVLGNTTTTSCDVVAGTGGAPSAAGQDFFGVSNGIDGTLTQLTFNPTSGQTQSFSGSIGDTSANTLSTGDNPGSGAGLLLQKNGAGLLILLGANTYSGGTNVTAGVLQGNTLSLQGNITDDTTVIFDEPSTGTPGTYAGVISGPGTLIKQNIGTTTFTGANTYTGGTTIDDGTLALSGAGSLDSAGFVSINAGTFDISGSTGTQTIGDLSGTGIVNLGANDLIEGTANSTTYSGVIQGTGGLAKQLGSSGTLTLTGTNTYTGGTIINAGTIALSGAGSLSSIGEVFIGSGGTFDISGINAASQTIGDLTGAAGGFVTLGAKGLITGTASNDTYAGIIQGTGSLTKQGSGTFTLTGANTYSGGTTINAGTLALSGAGTLDSTGAVTINAGTFDISGITAGTQTIGDLSGTGTVNLGAKELAEGTANNTTYAGSLQGVGGSLIKQGSGTLTLTGTSTYTGGTNINAGTLLVNGEIGSTVTVAANATLGGTGTVGDLINGGFVSPGESIGTLTVNGNYTQLPNGQLVIEIAPDGATDLLQVTGTATLNGSLHIVPEVGIYPNTTIYTFLTAASVTGMFSSSFSDIPIPYSVNYSPTSAFLIVSPFIITPVPNSALSGNARAVADYLFCTSFDFSNQDLVNLAIALTALPPSGYQSALTTLTPAPFAAFALEELENNYNVASTFFAQQVGQNPPCCEGIDATTNIWLSPIGFIYTQDNQHETPGFNDHTYGVSGGVDGLVADDLSIGVGLGYTHTHLNWNWGRGRSNANSAYLGPYLKYNYKAFYLDFLVLGVGNFYDVSRRIQFPGYSRKADSHPTTWDVSETLLVGLRFGPLCRSGILFQPEIRLDQFNMFLRRFTESGAGAINLDVENRYSSFFRTLVNAKFAREWSVCNTCLVPSVNVGWLRTTPLTGNHYTTKFRNDTFCQPNFTVPGFHKTINQVLVGAQFLASYQGCFDFSLGYQGKFGKGATVNEVNMGLNWRF
ncbi:MAG: autotransporter-associated beta strand repeat-containing protein [Candidatus Rhabdochlamydia sp.]